MKNETKLYEPYKQVETSNTPGEWAIIIILFMCAFGILILLLNLITGR